MAVAKDRSLATWVAGCFVTAGVFAVGLLGMVLLMVALNGFSQRAAAPIFIGYIVLLAAVNFVVVALATSLILKNAVLDPSALRRKWLLHGVVFTALPFLAFFAYFVTGGSI